MAIRHVLLGLLVIASGTFTKAEAIPEVFGLPRNDSVEIIAITPNGPDAVMECRMTSEALFLGSWEPPATNGSAVGRTSTTCTDDAVSTWARTIVSICPIASVLSCTEGGGSIECGWVEGHIADCGGSLGPWEWDLATHDGSRYMWVESWVIWELEDEQAAWLPFSDASCYPTAYYRYECQILTSTPIP